MTLTIDIVNMPTNSKEIEKDFEIFDLKTNGKDKWSAKIRLIYKPGVKLNNLDDQWKWTGKRWERVKI